MQTPLQPRGAGRLPRRTAVDCLLCLCRPDSRMRRSQYHAAASTAARDAMKPPSQPHCLVRMVPQCLPLGQAAEADVVPPVLVYRRLFCTLQAPASAARLSASSRPCGPG